MPYTALLRRSASLVLRPGLWLLALLMALDAGWQFALNTAFIYGGLVVLLRDVAGEQLPSWLTGATMFGVCFGAGLVCLLISVWGEAVLLSSIDGNRSLGPSIRSGWPRYGALLIVRIVVSLPAFALSGISAGSLVAFFRAMLQHGLNMAEFSLAILSVSALLSLIGTAIVIVAQCVAVGAERAAVLDRLNAWASLKLGWQLVWRQLGDFVVIGVLLLLVSLAMTAVLSCGGSVVLGGWLSTLLRDGTFSAISPAAWLGLIVSAWLVLALGYLFTTGVWTFAYQHWRGGLHHEKKCPV